MQNLNPFKLDDWTEESLEETWKIISKIATEKYGLDFYKPDFEVVTFEDMLHIYTGSFPIMYDHWSFGKRYEQLHKRYMADRMGVAYEVIFNTSPALCYLLEHNSPTMQGLVMAHAACGHSAVFKNNVFFREHTDAKNILSFLKQSKQFIEECEFKYGQENVERILDICHALQLYAIDRSKPNIKTKQQIEQLQIKRAIQKDQDFSIAVDAMPKEDKVSTPSRKKFREENILKFLGKNSSALKQWEKDIILTYCKIQQYFYPQMMTKVINEGFASFWHYTIMNDLSEMGYLEASNALEFLESHCAVLNQPGFDEKGYYGVNPYKLGFSIFQDIRRICENPTEEDRYWFPDLCGKNWIEEVKFAAYNFKDESFILQYLSPKVMRDFKLFSVHDDQFEEEYLINDIHDDDGYRNIRNRFSQGFDIFKKIPNIYIEGFELKKSRALYFASEEKTGRSLDKEQTGFIFEQYIKYLWPYRTYFKVIIQDYEERTQLW